MSDNLRRYIIAERQLLNRLLDFYGALLAKCETEAPNGVEVGSLAAMLHSFYMGVENIFERVVKELGETLPTGRAWHRNLLDAMANPTASRPAVISMQMRLRLDEYLSFRHAFRHAYSFDLYWDKMAPLVLDCQEVLRLFEEELDEFINSAD